MLKVGITGNIGSGKSTVSNLFKLLKIPVYSSDQRAKELMEGSAVLRKALIETFGDTIYIRTTLNRGVLAEKVFNNPKALKQLNDIVHPAVANDFKLWVAEQNAGYILKEAALLIESDSYKDLDTLILVSAPEDMRLQRAMRRDGKSKEQILERNKHQLPESELRKYCEFEIINDESTLVIQQVLKIHEALCTR